MGRALRGAPAAFLPELGHDCRDVIDINFNEAEEEAQDE